MIGHISYNRVASWLILICAALAPWFLGARSRIPGVPSVACLLMAGAFVLVAIAAPKRVFKANLLNCLVGLLLLCLVVFAIRGEPGFATAFSERLYTRLESNNPAGFIALPWAQRLAFIASCLLGLLAVARLALSGTFRRKLMATIGLSGLLVAVYSVAQRFFGLPLVPWALIQGAPERFNASFFHYSATAACINLAWPLVVFGLLPKWIEEPGGKRLIFQLLTLLLVMTALVPLGSAAGLAVAIGLALAGFSWPWLARHGLAGRRIAGSAVFGAFLVIGSWQAFEIWKVTKKYPDGWMGAAQTIRDAEGRDALVESLSLRRGDSIVPSDSPARPTLWLAGLRMAADYPFLGRGPGSWSKLSAAYSNDPFVLTFFHAVQFTHNDGIQFLAEWGCVPAVVAVMLFFTFGSRLPPTCVFCCVGVALHAMVDFPLQVPAIQCWTTLIMGVFAQKKPGPLGPGIFTLSALRIFSVCRPSVGGRLA